MGIKYSSQSTSGYNATPPADDGSEVASNQVFWSTIKTKLSDVLKTFAEAINSNLVTALDQSVLITSVARTTIAGDHIRTINVTAAATQSLGDAATMATGYIVTIKNSHTAAITVDLATGTDTLNGTVAGSYSLQAGEERTFRVNSTADGYLSSASNGVFTSVTSTSTVTSTNDIIMAEQADHSSTPTAGSGYVWVKDDAPNTLVFTDDAGNDNNISSAAAPANHIKAGHAYILNGDATSFSNINVGTDVTVATWETVGPTGSGATNIWTDLDNLPANTTMLAVDLDLTVSPSGINAALLQVYAASGDITTPVASTQDNRIGFIQHDADADITGLSNGMINRTYIPLNSSHVFKIHYALANQDQYGVLLYYRGFITN